MCTRPVSRHGFEIAILCALKVERDAVEAVMDCYWDGVEEFRPISPDQNTYTLGGLGGKPIVLAFLSGMGKLQAAAAANNMLISFPNLKVALVVGVCGGAPTTPSGDDILLGDVIISKQVIETDFGKMYDDGFRSRDGPEGTLGRLDRRLGGYLGRLEGDRIRDKMTSGMAVTLDCILREPTKTKIYACPGRDKDRLFPSDYRHKHYLAGQCSVCPTSIGNANEVCEAAIKLACSATNCDYARCLPRWSEDRVATRNVGQPALHFGRVGSSDAVIQSAAYRESHMKREEIICFEMEGAGTWDAIPTVVVKGVCDYADSHKNKDWQGYAALAAAACAKSMVEEWVSSLTISSDVPQVSHATASATPLSYAACRQALFITDPRDDLESARRRTRAGLTPETCKWVLRDENFTAWDNRPVSTLLCLVGEPGIGKTAMATFLVDHFLSENLPGETFAYFFCNNSVQNQRTATAILRGLLFLLLDHRPELYEHVNQSYQTKQDRLFTSSTALWPILKRIIRDPRMGNVTLLIDALDECEKEDIDNLLSGIADLIKHSPGSAQQAVKIVVTGRPILQVEQLCDTCHGAALRVLLSPKTIGPDLDKFIAHEVNALSPRWNSELRRQVRRNLEERNGGTFLWVALATKMISKVRPGLVLEELERFPKQLKDVYSRILREIAGNEALYAQRTLEIVIAARRPMTLVELSIALHLLSRTGSGSPKLPATRDIEDGKDRVRSCALILRIDEHDSSASVGILHQSVKDILLGEDLPLELQRYHINIVDAKQTLSQALGVFWQTDEISTLVKRLYGLNDIAKARHQRRYPWTSTSRAVRTKSDKQKGVWDVLPQEHIQFLQYLVFESRAGALQARPPRLVRQLLWKPQVPMNVAKLAIDDDLSSLLQTACLFIDHRYSLWFWHRPFFSNLATLVGWHDGMPQTFGYRMRNLLGWFSRNLYDVPVISLLLNRAASLRRFELMRVIANPIPSRPMPWAQRSILHAIRDLELCDAASELDDARKHLIDILHSTCSPGAGGAQSTTALHLLASISAPLAVKRCISSGFSILQMDEDSKTPLHHAAAASTRPFSALVEPWKRPWTDRRRKALSILLHANGGYEALYVADKEGRLPLHFASSGHGEFEAVKMLLQADTLGTTHLTVDHDGQLPLHFAAEWGHEQMVKVLVEADLAKTTLFARDNKGKTALDLVDARSNIDDPDLSDIPRLKQYLTIQMASVDQTTGPDLQVHV